MFKKLLLLDIDDTICNTTLAYQKGQQAAFLYLDKLEPKITAKQFNRLYWQARAIVHRQLGPTASSHNRFLYFQKMFEKLGLALKPKELDKITDIFWQTTNRHLKLFAGVRETLKILKSNNIQIGLVSDLLAAVQIDKLKYLKIADYVDFIVTSEEAGKDKPHPRIFELALKKAKANPSDAVMLGNDCKKDILGANRQKITAVYFGKGRCPIAKHKIKTFKEILPILRLGKKRAALAEGYVKFNYTWQKTGPLNVKNIKELNRYRDKFYKLKLIGAYPNGIGYGNISSKVGKGFIQHHLSKKSGAGFIISGTETGNFKKLTSQHYALVKSWDFTKNHLTCRGPIVASSESLSHAMIYHCDSTARAIIHVHNLKLWKKLLNKIPTTKKTASYGTVLMTKEIRRLFKETDLKNKKIFVMAGHREGVMAFGKNFEEAAKILLD